MADWLVDLGDHLRIEVIVVPRSSRTRVTGVHDQRLRIQLAAPPVDGKANDALVRFLAQTLDIAKAQIEITSGGNGRRKTVRLIGVSQKTALLRLSPAQQI